MSNMVVRYSDADLAEFKEIIDRKLAEAQANLTSLQDQIIDITENTSDEHGGDWMDDSSINNEMEMLNNMAIRQRMYIKDLENAQVRIRNKSYGICSITGDLIDKKRLLAVPTTTKSLSAKTEEARKEEKPTPKPLIKPVPQTDTSPKVITKVIRKSGGTGKPSPEIEDEDDFIFDREVFLDETEEEEEEEEDIIDRNVSDMDDFADTRDDDSDY